MNKIREARKAAGLTQQSMAEMFEIPKRSIENWEGGKADPPAWAEKLIIAELERRTGHDIQRVSDQAPET